MKNRDIVLAIFLVIVWGANFTVIKLGLEGVPSTLLVAGRYGFIVPAILFIKKPDISFKYIFFYGLTVGVGQFTCLFYAIEIGMPAGLASIIVQIQSFITPVFSVIFFKERIALKQLAGFAVAGGGLAIIADVSVNGDLSSIPWAAFVFVLIAPVFWSASNIVSRFASLEAEKRGAALDSMSLIVWSSLIPPLPMIGISFLIYQPKEILDSLISLNLVSLLSILYLAYASTLFGYGVWNSLINKYPLSKVAPIPLLVPVSGLLVAMIVLSERLSMEQWIGVLVILLGLGIANMPTGQLFRQFY